MTARSYCFTTFLVDEFAVPDEPGQIEYCIFQHEKCDTTQREHIQGYVELKAPKRIAGVKKLFKDNTMHLEKRMGTRTEAREYCRKESTRLQGPWEYGTWKEETEGGKRSSALEDVFKDIKKGLSRTDLLEKYPATFIRSHAGIEKALFISNTKKWSTVHRFKIKVIVLFGATGTGKTRRAFSKDNGLYKLDMSSNGNTVWFDGYDGQKTLLLDDFYGWVTWGALLNYLDIYPLRLNIKGSHTWAAWERIYITSNESWDQWYSPIKFPNQSALERRIHKVVHFEKITVNGIETISCDVLKNSKSYKTNGDIIQAEIVPDNIIIPNAEQ